MESLVTTVHGYIERTPLHYIEDAIRCMTPSLKDEDEDDELRCLAVTSDKMIQFLAHLYSEVGIELEVLQACEESDIAPTGDLLTKYNRIKKVCEDFFYWQHFVSTISDFSQIKDNWVVSEEYSSTEPLFRKKYLSLITDLIRFIGYLRDDLNNGLPSTPLEWPITLDN